MLGTTVTQSTTDASGKQTFPDVRLPDGYWGTPQQAKHQNVSGILVLPKPHLWDLRNQRWQHLLLRNPRVDHPLPDTLFPISGCRAAENGSFRTRARAGVGGYSGIAPRLATRRPALSPARCRSERNRPLASTAGRNGLSGLAVADVVILPVVPDVAGRADADVDLQLCGGSR